ncbi:MAG: ribonuclease HII [Bacteroidales bacterium]|jgi:ribonuclease HII|nr:ribonuclease HII [Bacteroidales bacterium]MDD2570939.1 ribonuclease HII [Bacteroidales bacterium]MDD2812773.1 ribonuclease HII [Bacteroidales bacterium]MDD3384298.1 ribonuclease HII [Bacteroidales bacterium]MDD3810789.1 ribonuclease HII [Bacteroidales bacterium]
MNTLTDQHQNVAGCDEAGRGCLAGPVYAAAVILPSDFHHPDLTDSKKMTRRNREKLRLIIEESAIAWAVASVDAAGIDEVNILNASIKAMHLAISRLAVSPTLLLIDGPRFTPYPGIPHRCEVRGDARFLNIAAASVLAKTHRDDYMLEIHQQHPEYGWNQNKGYPTRQHREAIRINGLTPYHRRTFRLTDDQLEIKF